MNLFLFIFANGIINNFYFFFFQYLQYITDAVM